MAWFIWLSMQSLRWKGISALLPYARLLSTLAFCAACARASLSSGPPTAMKRRGLRQSAWWLMLGIKVSCSLARPTDLTSELLNSLPVPLLLLPLRQILLYLTRRYLLLLLMGRKSCGAARSPRRQCLYIPCSTPSCPRSSKTIGIFTAFKSGLSASSRSWLTVILSHRFLACALNVWLRRSPCNISHIKAHMLWLNGRFFQVQTSLTSCFIV